MPAPDRAPHWLFRRLSWLASPNARPEQTALVLLPLIAAILFVLRNQIPAVVLVFLAAAELVALFLLLRRGWLVLLGPMFFYDLLCYARRGRYIALRCLYAGCLLAAIFGVYASWFGAGSFGSPLPQDMVARFAHSFFMTFLVVQLLTVFLLTPIVTASAIAEEKERRRLDFLLVTELHDHEIVLGKLASRVATVGLTLLTGLPILGLMQFLGGVDPNLVLAGFAVTLFTMVSVASVGMWMSSICDQPISAMWLTYLCVLAYLGLCWCPPAINVGHPGVLFKEIELGVGSDGNFAGVLLERVAGYGAVHLLISGVSVVLAMQFLRPDRAKPGLVARGVIASPTEPVRAPIRVVVPPPPPVMRRVLPPVDEEKPLLWKELNLEQEKTHEALKGLIAVVGVFLLFVVLMLCLTMIFAAIQLGRPLSTVTNPIARGLGSALGCFMLLGIVFHAVGTVSREREQQTLDSLLTLPVDRKEILWAKWLGSILSVRRLAWGLGVIWGLAMVTGGLSLLAVPLLVLAMAAHGAFAASLGLWFSVFSSSKVQATLRAILTLFVVMIASLILGEKAACTTPMVGFWMLAFNPHPFRNKPGEFPIYSEVPETEPGQLWLALLGATGYAILSVILWLWACERFRRE